MALAVAFAVKMAVTVAMTIKNYYKVAAIHKIVLVYIYYFITIKKSRDLRKKYIKTTAFVIMFSKC